MRILVIGLEGAAPGELLGREDLANVRRLMEAGCFGGLELPAVSDPAWEEIAHAAQVAAGGVGAVLIGVPLRAVPRNAGTVLVGCPVRAADGATAVASTGGAAADVGPRTGFEALRHHVARGDAGALVLVDRGGGPAGEAGSAADAEIGRVLEAIEGETAVLVVALPAPGAASGGAFVLAAPALPAVGAIEAARLADLGPTLLALGGGDLPAGLAGRNLVAGAAAAQTATDEDEERLVKERLAGLGYI